MKDEPVIALAQDFNRNASRLLRDEDSAEIVLSPLLHPRNIRLRCARVLGKDRLRLFHDRYRGDRFRIGAGELLLVAVKDAAEDKARQYQGLAASHLRYVDDAKLPLRKRMDQHVHELAAAVVEHLYDSGHVRS